MRIRRGVQSESMNLSLLDVISCGFGAVILMLVLTRVFEPVILAEAADQLDEQISALQRQILQLTRETTQVSRQLLREEDREAAAREMLARLQGERASLASELLATETDLQASQTVETRLVRAEQSLTEEMKRLLATYKRSALDNTVGGIPVDSEYVIFIIDTSGSMRTFAWQLVVQKMEETLNLYPQLKGIQVMNDMGHYMFPQFADTWIRDTPERRRQIVARLKSWGAFSNSSPVEGITRAIATFHRPDRKISLYVFGDEFSGQSIQRVVDVVDRINRADESGERLVRIHAVGFPVVFGQMGPFQETGIKFAILMRGLCAQGGGIFVGLSRHQL